MSSFASVPNTQIIQPSGICTYVRLEIAEIALGKKLWRGLGNEFSLLCYWESKIICKTLVNIYIKRFRKASVIIISTCTWMLIGSSLQIPGANLNITRKAQGFAHSQQCHQLGVSGSMITNFDLLINNYPEVRSMCISLQTSHVSSPWVKINMPT